MAGMMENLEEFKGLMAMVHVRADVLRGAIRDAREGVGGIRAEDDAILERINECLSQVGFLAIRKPESKASSGTDPWDR